ASSSATSASPSTDSGPAREPQERGVNGAGGPAVASRPPDASAGGPIVRAARPRGGYQVRPVYPESARRAGIQGTTLLRIYIERDGRVGDVSVQRSAGHQALDEAAADAVRRCRFEPALNSTGPVSRWALAPVALRIADRGWTRDPTAGGLSGRRVRSGAAPARRRRPCRTRPGSPSHPPRT